VGEGEGGRECARKNMKIGGVQSSEYVQAIPVASQTPRSKVASRFGFFFVFLCFGFFLLNVRREC
jgi:hypothetical protein